ncbi:MAG: GntR family transcriptional regulator, partial [Verrucomicrobiaceae bacterium]
MAKAAARHPFLSTSISRDDLPETVSPTMVHISSHPTTQPLPKRVHLALRTQLLDGSLPPGSRLDYKQLALQLGVSTTPVREAVAQLATEGFVELIPRLGAVVR